MIGGDACGQKIGWDKRKEWWQLAIRLRMVVTSTEAGMFEMNKMVHCSR
jgi:hypothetical protein